jgi:hypothetical protein
MSSPFLGHTDTHQLPENPLAQKLKEEKCDAENLSSGTQKENSFSGFRGPGKYVVCAFCGYKCAPFERSLGTGRFHKRRFEKIHAKKMASKNGNRGPPQ